MWPGGGQWAGGTSLWDLPWSQGPRHPNPSGPRAPLEGLRWKPGGGSESTGGQRCPLTECDPRTWSVCSRTCRTAPRSLEGVSPHRPPPLCPRDRMPGLFLNATAVQPQSVDSVSGFVPAPSRLSQAPKRGKARPDYPLHLQGAWLPRGRCCRAEAGEQSLPCVRGSLGTPPGPGAGLCGSVASLQAPGLLCSPSFCFCLRVS